MFWKKKPVGEATSKYDHHFFAVEISFSSISGTNEDTLKVIGKYLGLSEDLDEGLRKEYERKRKSLLEVTKAFTPWVSDCFSCDR